MSSESLRSVVLTALMVACPAPQPGTNAPRTPAADGVEITYPETRTVDHVDDYHGTQVADPYRWLEDIDSADTKAWVAAQNELTFGYLESIEARKALGERLTALWNYERHRVPKREGGRYFVEKNDGLQNQDVLYWTDRPEGKLELLLDPNTLSPDGTIALAKHSVSRDGKFLAYGLASAGSDWEQWHVREVETGRDTGDIVKWIKFSDVAWAPDGSGFYYARYDEPKTGQQYEDLNYYQKLYFHELGTQQANDELIYERKDQPKWGFEGTVTEDGRYLVIEIRVGTSPKNGVFFQDLKRRKRKTVELLPDFDARYEWVGNDGPVFWFRTDLDAPRGRLIAVDTRKRAKKHWKQIIGEHKDTLQKVSVVGDRFIATYLQDAKSTVRVHRLDGALENTVALPGIGTVAGFKGKRHAPETFFAFTSFTTPSTVYRYDVAAGSSTVLYQPKVAFDPTAFEIEQVFFKSKDGTRIPMFISHRKGIELDGNNPTYLYGYGGFNISITPRFSVPDLVWMEMGGIYAVPNLRGGGEYGEAWHEAGTKLTKQNVFDDFIGAAEWLIANKYTSSHKLAIGGRSNGGLLVGATMAQRPELFQAAIPGVGVMDMLRFHKFTIGWAWVSDYGSSDDAAEFKALHAYSPYHNLEKGIDYPATLIYTADHDDRVVPAHSYKFAAALQAAHAGTDPVLIRVDTKAGHGKGKPTAKRIDEWTDLWGFLVETLAMDASF